MIFGMKWYYLLLFELGVLINFWCLVSLCVPTSSIPKCLRKFFFRKDD
jgi:hypothetical protein